MNMKQSRWMPGKIAFATLVMLVAGAGAGAAVLDSGLYDGTNFRLAVAHGVTFVSGVLWGDFVLCGDSTGVWSGSFMASNQPAMGNGALRESGTLSIRGS